MVFPSTHLKPMDNRSRKDAHKRTLVARREHIRVLYKAILADLSLPAKVRYAVAKALYALQRKTAPTGIVNRCVHSGRAKAVYRKWKLSRISLRQKMTFGLLPGLIKASW